MRLLVVLSLLLVCSAAVFAQDTGEIVCKPETENDIETGICDAPDNPDGSKERNSEDENQKAFEGDGSQKFLSETGKESNVAPEFSVEPVATADRGKRQTVGSGVSDCQEWCRWYRPWWVYGSGRWWRVYQTRFYSQWVKYCWCRQKQCYGWIQNYYYRANCVREYAWRRLLVYNWPYTWPRRLVWRWFRFPVGCCCGRPYYVGKK